MASVKIHLGFQIKVLQVFPTRPFRLFSSCAFRQCHLFYVYRFGKEVDIIKIDLSCCVYKKNRESFSIKKREILGIKN